MASGLPTNNYLRVDDVAAELFSLPPAAALQFQAFLTKKKPGKGLTIFS